jgi:excisionase family DNA binding protein
VTLQPYTDGPPLAVLPEQQYTIRETADILKVAPITVRRMAARGELCAIGRGRLMRFALKDIRAWQDRNRQ